MKRSILARYRLGAIALLVPLVLLVLAACTMSDIQLIPGTIQSVEAAQGKVTIQTADGKTLTLDLDSGALEQTAGTTSVPVLAPGTRVKLEVKGSRVVRRIHVEDGLEAGEVKGSVVSTDGAELTIATGDGRQITLTTNDATRIELKDDDVPGSLEGLKVGDRVEAKFDPATNTAVKIELKEPEPSGSRSGRRSGSVSERCGTFVATLGDQTFSGEQRMVIPAAQVTGQVLMVDGEVVDFSINLDTFAISNFTVSGTPLYTSVAPELGSPLTGDLELRLDRDRIVLKRGDNNPGMSMHADDCNKSGILEMESESAATTTLAFQLAAGTSYVEEVGSRLVFDGAHRGFEHREGGAQLLSFDAQTSHWSVPAEGSVDTRLDQDPLDEVDVEDRDESPNRGPGSQNSGRDEDRDRHEVKIEIKAEDGTSINVETRDEDDDRRGHEEEDDDDDSESDSSRSGSNSGRH